MTSRVVELVSDKLWRDLDLVNGKFPAYGRMVATKATAPQPYHHGDLRRVLLAAAAQTIVEDGVGSLSMRELARRVGVSHAAPAHHFGDKRGLLTALAVEGYSLLGQALGEAWERTGDFLEVGVAYVGFAVGHRAHFEVMFRPDLYDAGDPDLAAARAASRRFLYGPAAELAPDAGTEAGVAAWALVHGLAWLWLDGILPPEVGDDPEALARAVARHLF